MLTQTLRPASPAAPRRPCADLPPCPSDQRAERRRAQATVRPAKAPSKRAPNPARSSHSWIIASSCPTSFANPATRSHALVASRFASVRRSVTGILRDAFAQSRIDAGLIPLAIRRAILEPSDQIGIKPQGKLLLDRTIKRSALRPGPIGLLGDVRRVDLIVSQRRLRRHGHAGPGTGAVVAAQPCRPAPTKTRSDQRPRPPAPPPAPSRSPATRAGSAAPPRRGAPSAAAAAGAARAAAPSARAPAPAP